MERLTEISPGRLLEDEDEYSVIDCGEDELNDWQKNFYLSKEVQVVELQEAFKALHDLGASSRVKTFRRPTSDVPASQVPNDLPADEVSFPVTNSSVSLQTQALVSMLPSPIFSGAERPSASRVFIQPPPLQPTLRPTAPNVRMPLLPLPYNAQLRSPCNLMPSSSTISVLIPVDKTAASSSHSNGIRASSIRLVDTNKLKHNNVSSCGPSTSAERPFSSAERPVSSSVNHPATFAHVIPIQQQSLDTSAAGPGIVDTQTNSNLTPAILPQKLGLTTSRASLGSSSIQPQCLVQPAPNSDLDSSQRQAANGDLVQGRTPVIVNSVSSSVKPIESLAQVTSSTQPKLIYRKPCRAAPNPQEPRASRISKPSVTNTQPGLLALLSRDVNGQPTLQKNTANIPADDPIALIDINSILYPNHSNAAKAKPSLPPPSKPKQSAPVYTPVVDLTEPEPSAATHLNDTILPNNKKQNISTNCNSTLMDSNNGTTINNTLRRGPNISPIHGTSVSPLLVDLTSDDPPVSDEIEHFIETVSKPGKKPVKEKTFPSLAATATPILKQYSSSDSNIQRLNLDNKLRKVVQMSPTIFIEHLLIQSLLKSDQCCQRHKALLHLNVSPNFSHPHSGGYVWTSKTCNCVLSVFSGSIFDSPVPPINVLKMIYHWACNTSVPNVVQWVKVDKTVLKTYYSFFRSVCTTVVHEKSSLLGGPMKKIQIGVISVGTDSFEGKQIKIDILGALDTENLQVRLKALNTSDVKESWPSHKVYEVKFRRIMETLQTWIHPQSILVTDFEVDYELCSQYGFPGVIVIGADSTETTNFEVMEYLRNWVPKMFQKTLSLLPFPTVQQFVDELVWRETWGSIPSLAFDNFISHVAELTKLPGPDLIVKLRQIASNPSKSWKYAVWDKYGPRQESDKPEQPFFIEVSKQTSSHSRQAPTIGLCPPPVPMAKKTCSNPPTEMSTAHRLELKNLTNPLDNINSVCAQQPPAPAAKGNYSDRPKKVDSEPTSVVTKNPQHVFDKNKFKRDLASLESELVSFQSELSKTKSSYSLPSKEKPMKSCALSMPVIDDDPIVLEDDEPSPDDSPSAYEGAPSHMGTSIPYSIPSLLCKDTASTKDISPSPKSVISLHHNTSSLTNNIASSSKDVPSSPIDDDAGDHKDNVDPPKQAVAKFHIKGSKNNVAQISYSLPHLKSQLSDRKPLVVAEKLQFLETYYYGYAKGNPARWKKYSGMFLAECVLCKADFLSCQSFSNHLIEHALNEYSSVTSSATSNKKPLRTFCRLCCTIVESIDSHMDIKHKFHFDEAAMCKICNEDFMNKENLIQHMTNVHCELDMPYRCEVCRFRTSVYEDIVSHSNEYHSKEAYLQCPFCLKAVMFISQRGTEKPKNQYFFIQHIQKHSFPELRKKCEKCKLSFTNLGSLKKHQVLYHQSGKSLKNVQRGFKKVKKLPECTPMNSPTSGPLPPSSLTEPSSTLKGIALPVSISVKQDCHSSFSRFNCCECDAPITKNHFFKKMACISCRFQSWCANAMREHSVRSHPYQEGPNVPWNPMIGGSPILDKKYFCSRCWFSTKNGDSLAAHLTKCEKKAVALTEKRKAFSHFGSDEDFYKKKKLS